MRIYLASRFARRVGLQEIRDRLEATGHTVTSRWIDEEPNEFRHGTPEWERHARHRASIDLSDILQSELMIVDVDVDTKDMKGGLYVEMGYGIALLGKVWVIGPPTNIFCVAPTVSLLKDWGEAFRLLGVTK